MYRVLVVRAPTDTIGSIVIRLFPSITPLHARNFDSIARAGRFDNTAFHRVVPGFVIQGGDPNSISGSVDTWGYGDPSQPKVNAEFTTVRHDRGRLGMARGNDFYSATSQFYICHGSPLFLDKNYTVFGETISGLEVVDSVALSARYSSDRPLVKLSMYVSYMGEDSTRPGIPMPFMPAMNARKISTSAFTSFQWTAAQGALRTIIEVSTDSTFTSSVLVDASESLSTDIKLSEGVTTYYWRVRGDNGGGYSEWSPRFVLTTSVATPTLLEPRNNATNQPTSLDIRWAPANGLNPQYHVQVATSSIFLKTQLILDTNVIDATSWSVRNLLPAKKYYWRTSAIVDGDTSIYSKPFAFTTGSSTGADDESISRQYMHVSPQPAIDHIDVSLVCELLGDAHVSVMDLQGNEIYRETRHIKNETETTLRMNCTSIVPGLYIIRVVAGNYHAQQTFIKY